MTRKQTKPLIRTLHALALAGVSVAAGATADDGAALAAQCAAQDWGTYMGCQQSLLDARNAGEYCVELPENGARYQVEFIRFLERAPARTRALPAADAAAAFFRASYPCKQ